MRPVLFFALVFISPIVFVLVLYTPTLPYTKTHVEHKLEHTQPVAYPLRHYKIGYAPKIDRILATADISPGIDRHSTLIFYVVTYHDRLDALLQFATNQSVFVVQKNSQEHATMNQTRYMYAAVDCPHGERRYHNMNCKVAAIFRLALKSPNLKWLFRAVDDSLIFVPHLVRYFDAVSKVYDPMIDSVFIGEQFCYMRQYCMYPTGGSGMIMSKAFLKSMSWLIFDNWVDNEGAGDDMTLGCSYFQSMSNIIIMNYAGMFQYPYQTTQTQLPTWSRGLEKQCSPRWICEMHSGAWNYSWIPLSIHPVLPSDYGPLYQRYVQDSPFSDFKFKVLSHDCYCSDEYPDSASRCVRNNTFDIGI